MKIIIKTDQNLNEVLKNSEEPKLLGFWEKDKFVPNTGQMILGEEFINGERFATIINAD